MLITLIEILCGLFLGNLFDYICMLSLKFVIRGTTWQIDTVVDTLFAYFEVKLVHLVVYRHKSTIGDLSTSE